MDPDTEAGGQRGGRHGRAGLVLLCLLTVFWGINWPAIKYSVSEVPVWTFRSICLLTGAGGLFAIAAAMRLPLGIPRREIWKLLRTSLTNITGWHMFSALGVTLMLPGRASILAFTMPLWAAPIAAIWLGERMDRVRLAGLGIGLCGIAVLLLPDWRSLHAAPLGPVFMLCAAISWAHGTVSLKASRFTMPTTTLVAWQLLLGGVPVFLGALVFDSAFAPSGVSLPAWIAVGYSAIVPMIFCHWAWFRVVSIYPAQVAAIGTLAIPVVGVLSSSLMTGERIGGDEVLALGLVVSALFLVLVLPQLRRAKG